MKLLNIGHVLLLTPAQAGDLLGVTSQTVRNMIKRGELESRPVGRRNKVPMAEIERIVNGRNSNKS